MTLPARSTVILNGAPTGISAIRLRIFSMFSSEQLGHERVQAMGPDAATRLPEHRGDRRDVGAVETGATGAAGRGRGTRRAPQGARGRPPRFGVSFGGVAGVGRTSCSVRPGALA